MKKIFLAAAILSLSTINFQLSAQTSDPVVLEVGGKAIRQSEFMKDFMNTVGNSLNAKPDITAADKRRELDEYVELYANFRAKDLDARSLGMDTEEGLQKELNRYRTELAAPYLIDSAVAQRILRNAYEHNRYTLHAAHILVQVRPGASPADTLEAYQRAMGYRERALKGEDFFALSSEEVHRVQPDAPKNEYEGELNCFTAFDMVYPFEEGAYALKEGEISMPVRSRFGYHIIKLIDKMELYGRLTLQHIWVSNKNDELGINEMYNRLQEGVPFEMVARQSDDMSTSDKGGYIVDAMPSQLPHEYVKVLAGLKEGEYSAPFLTRYGWHIVRLVKKEQMPTFEELVPLYRQRLSRDPRGEMSKKSFAVTARKKYNMVDYTQMKQAAGKRKGKKKQPVKMMASLDELVSIINDSVFRGQWRYDESALTDQQNLLQSAMKRLQQDGYKVWLDDFGSGYSSLNVLKDYQFDVLKIDMKFLSGFKDNEKTRPILENIVSLTKQLKMLSLTEGVETAEQFSFLEAIGCDRAQGYLFSKPVPIETLRERISAGELKISPELSA